MTFPYFHIQLIDFWLWPVYYSTAIITRILEMRVGLWLWFCSLEKDMFSGSASFYTVIHWQLFGAFVWDIFGGPLLLQDSCMMLHFLAPLLVYLCRFLGCPFFLVYLVWIWTWHTCLGQIPFECHQSIISLISVILTIFFHLVQRDLNHQCVVYVS